jgi:hypothetical protein
LNRLHVLPLEPPFPEGFSQSWITILTHLT